ncbi:MAG: type 1 glutamine amidotransferase [Methanomethylovorans sp.]|nr:type 1 glutamine amidotransferase [Methanomethylovorans sp.]
MIIYCLYHIDFENFWNLKEWALLHDHMLRTANPSKCLDLLSPDNFDMLVIMGGTMSVYEKDEHQWLYKEKAFVKEILRLGKPILGICFGGQMLAQLLGADVRPNAHKEIGWHHVRKIPVWHDLLKGLPDTFPVFQWHGDTFEIPECHKIV